MKKNNIAIIASVVLGLMLLIGIIVANVIGIKQIKDSTNVEVGTVAELKLNAKDFFKVEDDVAEKITFDTSNVDLNKVGEYEVIAKHENKEYTITVIVEDTKAPQVSMAQRYIFTNDIAKLNDFSTIVKEVKDASEVTYKLVRFEKKKELVEVNDLELRNLTEGVTSFAKEEALLVGTEEVPTQPGIYRGVLEIADASGNTSYEEIILVLDMTGAKIEDTPDKTITVSKDKLTEEPEVDKSEYTINDNVDGKIPAENIITELKLRDAEKHEWLVHVSYVDRAGNESKAVFLIIVKEKESKKNTNNGNSNNGGNTNNGESTNQNENTQPEQQPSQEENKTVEDESGLNEYQKIIVAAGYGNVVDWGDGTYSVLVHKDLTANGKNGRVILEEYLAERGLEIVQSQAGIMDEDNDWYVYSADEVREIPEDNYWEGGEVEWID